MAEFSLEEVTGTQPVPPKEYSLEEVTGTQTAPVETPEKIDEDELDNNQEWLSNALLIYQAEEGEDWKRLRKNFLIGLKIDTLKLVGI